ncbi:glucan endo-1,3-beta-glucosidase 14-like [Macadamia integrifolia]|uniref:glucan endo-1,3-beta-glucosidase 14-like n=1 Tax=Macadamia integrifolia TaxID=60698 RepID=UPI001C4E5F3C|nr:glucan endo-1,3-beta-glucosidase 14-like [Macadamia integrifolia]
MAMADSLCFRALFQLLFLSGLVVQILSLRVGINYGQIGDNLPTPAQVAVLLESNSISKVKLYDADPNVLQAFSGSNVEFIVEVGNNYLQSMTNSNNALAWLKQYVQPYIAKTKINCITVGNEVFASNDSQLMSYVLPAMQNIYNGLVSLGLNDQINVSSAHSLAILATSYPPSSGTFEQSLAQYIQPILSFHSQIKSPFLINAYPYFAYKASPSQISLPYVLFESNSGVTDSNTNLKYDNMLYAQIDAVYSAMKVMGYTDIEVRISETGWPSKGDADEAGATPANARLYNGNLLQRIEEKQGTPMKPSTPIDVYIFALFNEDLKPGPTSERNYGLYYPNCTSVYEIDLQGYLSQRTTSSASSIKVISISTLLIFFTALLISI